MANSVSHGSMCKDGNSQGQAVPPVAIVGMAMRLPGDVHTADEFWDLLISQRDCSSEVPQSRYNVDAFYHPDKPQFVKTRRGYFLNDDYLNKTDHSFFSAVPGITMNDLDPQQMSLMEVIWECMENAGQTEWRGKKIGCYVGVFGEDWHELTAKETQAIPRVHAFANGGFALSNRVSFEYDLKGPSATIHTACSSSLTALHEACQSLYTGSCSSAIVAGTSMLLTPSMSVTMSENGVLSPDGRCKVFDADADGYARGEAVNAILIKPLDQAIADGDGIRAIIRATSANYDGRTAKIVAPDVESQERLMREAYSRAGIQDISQTAFVECHGTGTKVGDLVETTAVARTFGGKGVCIGSVKSNVGHGEGASGLTGVIKAVLALEHRTIPPNLHFSRPNPNIPFEKGGLRVPVEPTSWPLDRMERVGVNCFGIGGSNAHVILDSASTVLSTSRETQSLLETHLVAISAQSKPTLTSRLADIHKYLLKRPHAVRDLAYTLGARRDHLSHRGYLICDATGHVFETQSNAPAVTATPSVVFTFTGQGAQWAGMGRDLLASFETFRCDIRAMDQILQELASPPTWSIEAELQKPQPSSSVDKTEYSQTMCAAIQIALVNLFARWAIHPSAVIGYSSGEVIAAYAANAISMRTAITIAHFRGRTAELTSRDGGMAVVGLGKADISQFLVDGVVIACENSPESVNISGEKEKLMAVMENILTERPETFTRQLPLEVAYHSRLIHTNEELAHMQNAGALFEANIAPHIVQLNAMLPMYSTVTGALHSDPSALDAAYWRRNLESPVLFSSAVQNLLNDRKAQATLFVEIGSHSTLAGPLRQIVSHQSVQSHYIPTLLKNTNQVHCVLKAVGELYSQGCHVEFAAIHPGKILTDLPLYPWDRKTIDRQESRLSRNWRFREHSPHELLGSRMLEATDIEPAWRNLMSSRDVPWIVDHQVLGEIVFPCAGYIAIINEATRQLFHTQDCTIRNLHMKVPLVLPRSGGDKIEIVTSMRPLRINDRLDSKWHEFSISSYDGGEWTKHTVGQVLAGVEDLRIPTVPKPFARSVSSPFWYDQLSKVGLQYGPAFQGLENITADPVSHTASATIAGKPKEFEDSDALHPTAIDECLQLFSVAACNGKAIHLKGLYVPLFIDEICLGKSRDSMKVHVTGNIISGIQGQGDVVLMTDDNLVLSMRGVTLAQMDHTTPRENSGIPLLSQCEWKPDLDFLPGHIQLPKAESDEHTSSLMAKASVLSMIQVHRNMVDVNPTSTELPGYERWLQAQIERFDMHRISVMPEALPWTQRRNGSLEALWNSLEQQLKAANLGLVFDLYQQTVKEKRVPLENEQSSPSSKIKSLLQNLEDWFTSRCDLSGLFSLLRHHNPRLRILEIGTGRGSLASTVLQYLTCDGIILCSQYTATERLHIEDALKDRLQEYDQVEFKIFDPSHDPCKQDIETGHFDVVIASNMGAHTSSLGTTLKNIGKLLVPGGRLLLHENGPGEHPLPSKYFDGLGVNVDSKHMSVNSWDSELRQAGFLGVEADSCDGETPYHFYRNLISRLPLEDHLQDSTVYLLCPDNGTDHPWLRQVEHHFVQNGLTVQRVSKGEEISPKQRVISFLDLERPFFSNISQRDWESFQQLINSFPQILWVTNSVELHSANPDFSIVMGVSRTARQEQEIQFGTLQVDRFDTFAVDALLRVSRKFFSPADQSGLMDADYEFALHDGTIYIPRMQWSSLTDKFLCDPELETAKLDIDTYGSLESMHWAEDHPPESPGENEVEVDVKFVGVNFRDVMITQGIMANKEELGLEASGIVRRCGPGVKQYKPGDRVLVMQSGLFRTRVVLPIHRCAHLPPTLSLEDAASMAVVYATVIYCLLDIGRVEEGQSVLIHAACGGVGLAAMQVCRMMGAKVYATVGSAEKANYLMEHYGISRNHIFSSRDTSFLPALMRETNGQGVDIVLNSLAGEFLHASWKCVAEFGKMIEIGKRDFLEHGTLGLEAFGGNRAFFGVDLIRVAQRPGLLARLVSQLLNLCAEGKISPIRPLKVIPSVDTQQAFRYIQQGLHMGKIIVQMPEASERDIISKSRRRARFSPDLSYLLVGGLGGIGRAIAAWMVEQGARNLTFLSRSAGTSSQDQLFRHELELLGCNVVMAKCDVTMLEGVQGVIDASPCPIGGVLQLSMVIRDQFIPDMTHRNWEDAIAAKVTGTWNLHRALDGKDAKLQFFVVCGSVTGVMGNAGQVNYSAANTFVSSFAQHRLQKGLPASVVNLGGVDDVGFLATQDTKLRERMRGASVRLLSEQEVLDAFELAILCGGVTHNSSSTGSLRIPNNFIVGMSSTKSLADPSVRSLWGQDARFRAYGNLDSKQQVSHELQNEVLGFQKLISMIKNNPEMLNDALREDEVTTEMVKNVQEYSIFAREMDYAQVASLHIDSLMTVEIRNWARRHLDMDLSLVAISKAGTIGGLGKLVLSVLRSKYLK
ncbi:uncharacterized protein N7459_006985 [Penicillium hispanicum]|uniref:uncharacterized protein n=1 Tax=Penicillium hispanicum TaxID=1080232 RepID=UPI002540F4C3|nr:uncharacterized protein N7459_006985 [Penicillium hispanicum]KAJ5578021.1 hypothetical protein N7459_006985 [Penicillium hispanicum]